ncbi:MAG TPA: hypothetical protein VMM76_13120 [Pirellulaceae bacterium]|nr:hypothetical protein [Pirellulaceae bacterium]
MRDEFHIESRRTIVPAWLLSIGAHVVLLICISFLAVGASDLSLKEEPARPVGIVLARKSANVEHEYFEEISEDAPERDSSVDASAEDRSSQPDVPANQPESFVLSEFALPKTSDLPLVGVTSIDTPRLTVSNSRPKLPGIDESAIIADEQARLRAATARGPTAKLGVFGSKEATGGSFVFLIDRSQSMGVGGLGVLQDAEDELVRVLNGLQAEHRFQVAVYHDKSVYLERRELLPATEANKALVPGFLSTKAAFGATGHEGALMSALSLEPDVIFLLTDGGEPALKDQEIRAIAKFAVPRTSIHCIQFGTGPPRESNNFLARLAAATGGEYGYVDVNQRRK